MKKIVLGLVLVAQVFALNEHELFEVSNVINTSLPQRIDEHTLFVNSISSKNKLRYTYVITSFENSEVNIPKRKAFELKEKLLLCKSKHYKVLLDQKIEFYHRYLDKNLQFMFEVIITPKACKKRKK